MGLADRPRSTFSGDREARIHSLIADPGGLSVPGYAVGVFHDGRTSEIVTTGARDVAAHQPIDENTQFYVGSVSKQFTALALMNLVTAGRVSLDDDVRRFLPELPSYARPVTVSMLLHHVAGIRESLALLMLAGFRNYAAATRAEVLALLLRQQATDFEPGTRCHYTNGGYLLLSEIVERVAGEAFADHVNRTILEPLGMTRSYMLAGERRADSNLARGYQVTHGEVTLSDKFPLFAGSGGLVSNLADFARYDYDIDTGHKVWTPEITRLMLQPGRCANDAIAVPDGLVGSYASGLMLGPHWISHGGAALGLKANYARLPARRIGVAVLCNRGEVDLDERLNAIVASLNEELPPVVVTAPDIMLGRYVSNDLDAVYELSRQRGTLLNIRILDLDGIVERKSLLLTQLSDGSFIGADSRLVMQPDDRSFVLQTPHLTLEFKKR